MKTARGHKGKRLTVGKMTKGHNSGKNPSRMTSVNYAHLQVKGTITKMFHQNPLTSLKGIAETRLTYGRTDRMTGVQINIRTNPLLLSLRLRRGTRMPESQ